MYWRNNCTAVDLIGMNIPQSLQAINLPSNLSQYCLIFLHNTDVNMLYRLFGDRKYMYINLPIHQEYSYLSKQKISLYFPASTCEHLWPSPCIVHSHKQEISPVEDLASTATTTKHQRFTLNIHRFKLWKRS